MVTKFLAKYNKTVVYLLGISVQVQFWIHSNTFQKSSSQAFDTLFCLFTLINKRIQIKINIDNLFKILNLLTDPQIR